MQFLMWLALKNMERVINLAIQLDPFTLSKLPPLVGKTITIQITGLNIQVHVQITASGIQFLQEAPKMPTLQIQGPPLSLIALALGDKTRLKQTDIRLSGDMVMLQQIASCLSHLDIHLEEHLSKIFGDVLVHQAVTLHARCQDQRQAIHHAWQNNLRNYLQEESDLLIASPAVDDYIEQVHEIRLAVDRLNARVERLCRKLSTHAS